MKFKFSYLIVLFLLLCCILFITIYDVHNRKTNDNSSGDRSPLRKFEREMLASNNVNNFVQMVDVAASTSEPSHQPSNSPVTTDIEETASETNAVIEKAEEIGSNVVSDFASITTASITTTNITTDAIVSNIANTVEQQLSMRQLPPMMFAEAPSLESNINVVVRRRVAVHEALTVDRRDRAAFLSLAQLHQIATEVPANDETNSGDIFKPSVLVSGGSSVQSATTGYQVKKAFQFGVLERFHQALSTGSDCIEVAPEYPDAVWSSLLQSLTDALQTVRPKLLIEYGTALTKKTITYSLGLARPALTALFVQLDDSSRESSGQQSRCSRTQRGSNMYVSLGAGPTGDQMDRHQSRSAAGSLPLDCVQVVHGLDSLVRDQLPFEFEEALGNTLCRCNLTYIPMTLPDNSYFAFWESASALVKAAVAVSAPRCDVSVDMTNSSVKYIAGVKYSHVIVQRLSPDNATYSGAPPSNTGHLPVGLLSALPLDDESARNLGVAVAEYLGTADLRHLSTAVVSSALNQSDGSTVERFDVDVFDAQGLAALVDGLAVRGSAVFNETDDRMLSGADSLRSRKLGVNPLREGVRSRSSAAAAVPKSSSTDTDQMKGAVDDAVMGSAMRAEEVTDLLSVQKSDTQPLAMNNPGSVVQNDSLITPVAEQPNVIVRSWPFESNSANVTVAATAVDNTTAPVESATRRRRLYAYNSKSSSSSSSTSTSGSSSNSASSVEKLQPYSLSWELPDRANVVAEQAGFDPTDADIHHRIQESQSSRKSGGRRSRGSNDFPSSSSTLSSAARAAQRELQNREDGAYRTWMFYLKQSATEQSLAPSQTTVLSGMEAVSRANLVYVLGRQATMLSIKLAKMMQSRAADDLAPDSSESMRSTSGLLVSLLADPASLKPHQQLLKMVNLKNNLVCFPDWSSPSHFSALLATPERADVMVLQSDVLLSAIAVVLASEDSALPLLRHSSSDKCTAIAVLLEEAVVALLSLSDVSFVELPSPMLLQHLLARMHSGYNECAEYFGARYSTRGSLLLLSLAQLPSKATASVVELQHPDSADEVDAADSSAKSMQVFRVAVSYAHSVGSNADSGHSATVDDIFRKKDGSGPATLLYFTKGSSFGLSIYSATHFGLVDAHRRLLLNMLVNLPVWNLGAADNVQVVPWQLFVRLTRSYQSGVTDLSLWLHDVTKEDMRAQSATGRSVSMSRHSASIAARLSPGEIDAKGSRVGISIAENSPSNDRTQGMAVWNALEAELSGHSGELAGGKFSFVEHNSGFGYVSTRLAKRFPNATVISLEKNAHKVSHHVAMAEQLGLLNNAVCLKTAEDSVIHKNIYESPELFRFQLRSHNLMEDFVSARTMQDWGATIGTLLSTALTTFIYAPSAAQVSWAMHVLFGEVYEYHSGDDDYYARSTTSGPYRPLSDVLGGAEAASSSELLTQVRGMSDIMSAQHPQHPYLDFESTWLLESARVAGGLTTVVVSPLAASEEAHQRHMDSANSVSDTAGSSSLKKRFSIPIVRCDIVNMTRHVHHHYEYGKDGHTRTYTMRVVVNDSLTDAVLNQLGDPSKSRSVQLPDHIALSTASNLDHNGGLEGAGGDSLEAFRQLDSNLVYLPPGYHPSQHKIVGVHLLRDRDSFPIPYTSIYGVTLIATLRLGLDVVQRDKLFAQFLRLPLYEDMAPWNVVLMGQTLDYIDYDTREVTYNADIPKAYRVMSVLMNYKRTVEDFKRCGSKAGTVYGLPYVSDCVGSSTYDKGSLSCPELSLPVPCGDGTCHSDYISCLRSLSVEAERAAEQSRLAVAQSARQRNQQLSGVSLDSSLAAAMKSVVGRFDDKAYSSLSFEQFEQEVRRQQQAQRR